MKARTNMFCHIIFGPSFRPNICCRSCFEPQSCSNLEQFQNRLREKGTTRAMWKYIIDSLFVLACGPPGGGRNPVTPRFFRHFNCICYSEMEDAVMHTIFSTILSNFLTENTRQKRHPHCHRAHVERATKITAAAPRSPSTAAAVRRPRLLGVLGARRAPITTQTTHAATATRESRPFRPIEQPPS